LEVKELWHSNKIDVNFSCDDVWGLGEYTIDFKTDLNLYARKDNPETNFETNTGSLGTMFSVGNNSNVIWDFYSYFSVPTGYKENKMKLEYPVDAIITWVSEPQDPSINRLSMCDNSTPGLLIIPVNTISTTPDGFWKFKARTPNYCKDINIFRNTTITPSFTEWIQSNKFMSGDYINITAKISNPAIVSEYINQTKVILQIRFPNGTLWSDKKQIRFPDINGYINFTPLHIPIHPPNYEVGEYEVIITWNNSYSKFGLNETGIIYKKFTVTHKSLLIPDQVYYEDIFEGDIINLKVSFNDKEDYTAIRDAKIYLDNFSGGRQFFSEISPGYYFLECLCD